MAGALVHFDRFLSMQDEAALVPATPPPLATSTVSKTSSRPPPAPLPAAESRPLSGSVDERIEQIYEACAEEGGGPGSRGFHHVNWRDFVAQLFHDDVVAHHLRCLPIDRRVERLASIEEHFDRLHHVSRYSEDHGEGNRANALAMVAIDAEDTSEQHTTKTMGKRGFVALLRELLKAWPRDSDGHVTNLQGFMKDLRNHDEAKPFLHRMSIAHVVAVIDRLTDPDTAEGSLSSIEGSMIFSDNDGGGDDEDKEDDDDRMTSDVGDDDLSSSDMEDMHVSHMQETQTDCTLCYDLQPSDDDRIREAAVARSLSVMRKKQQQQQREQPQQKVPLANDDTILRARSWEEYQQRAAAYRAQQEANAAASEDEEDEEGGGGGAAGGVDENRSVFSSIGEAHDSLAGSEDGADAETDDDDDDDDDDVFDSSSSGGLTPPPSLPPSSPTSSSSSSASSRDSDDGAEHGDEDRLHRHRYRNHDDKGDPEGPAPLPVGSPRRAGIGPRQIAHQMFVRMDKDGSGEVNVREFILALRKSPGLALMLGLPERILQEDGSRDRFEAAFQEMDLDGTREISWEEFTRWLDARSKGKGTGTGKGKSKGKGKGKNKNKGSSAAGSSAKKSR
eukprot:g2076.t1